MSSQWRKPPREPPDKRIKVNASQSTQSSVFMNTEDTPDVCPTKGPAGKSADVCPTKGYIESESYMSENNENTSYRKIKRKHI